MSLANQKVFIVGLGWLGLPLAFSLSAAQANVYGSVSSEQKRDNYAPYIDTQHFNLYSTLPSCLLPTHFSNAVMVLNIPPGRRDFEQKRFVQNMLKLIDHAMQNGLRQLIFISTTSVFNGHFGRIINSTRTKPTTASGFAHQDIEQHLLSHYSDKVCIIRPSGLIGPTINLNQQVVQYRHPIFSLSAKTDIRNGNDRVNLVHQNDLIAAITQVMKLRITAKSFNLAAIEHPTRFEYYTWCAKQLDLPLPDFNQQDLLIKQTEKNTPQQQAKTIDACDTFEQLGLIPVHASPYSMLPS
jgi:nucleoside-diphosphate-sugar epimerase